MILKLSNKENTYTFTVDDLNNGEKLYYKFQIPASDVVDGKYNMVLMDDEGNIITEEQVCMGYFNAETIQYNRGENVYINSPLNANIEDVRTITIDVPNYTIYPSDNYDAMKEVVVDAQPIYNNGYNAGEVDGYNSGYTAGEVEQKSKLTNITISENGTYTREDGYNTVVVNVPDLNGDYQTGYDEGYADGVENGVAEELEKLPILDITENGEYRTINKGVNVNVVPKIDVAENGIKFGYSTFTEVPYFYDFSNVTDMNNMFNDCNNLQTISQLDTSNVTSMNYMFYNCSNLQTISSIDTSNVTSMNRMFFGCSKLAALPELDVSKVIDITYYFRTGGGSLTDVGGWKNLKIDWNDNYGLVLCPNLTYQSCINILNGLADVTELGGKTLKVHQNFIDLVGDEISIGILKGWSISA